MMGVRPPKTTRPRFAALSVKRCKLLISRPWISPYSRDVRMSQTVQIASRYGGGTGPTNPVRQGAVGAGRGAVAGAIIGNNAGSGNAASGAAIGALAGGAAGAIRGSNQDRNNQQRYRDNQGRYYYCYDNRQSECYWENGQRRY